MKMRATYENVINREALGFLWWNPGALWLLLTELLIKVLIKCVEVFAIQLILNQAKAFAESLIVNQFALAQIFDRVAHIGVFYETEDVVVGQAGFLFCCQVLMKVCNGIPGGLDHAGTPWLAGSSLWPQTDGVVHVVRGEALLLQFLCGEVLGELVDDGTHNFHVSQFFGTEFGGEIAPRRGIYFFYCINCIDIFRVEMIR